MRSLGRLLRTRYPKFVFGLPLDEGRIPIFVYHDVDPGAFRSDLTFLRDNGYRALAVDEFFAREGRDDTGKAVLLTFDDARRNFFETAFPLLSEFGAHATLFVPTRWIRGEAARPPESESEADPTGRELFMTWDEMRACLRSGLVDVQSHTHRHALVHRSNQLVGFCSPEGLSRFDVFEWPARRGPDRIELGIPPVGTPVYASRPLLSTDVRYAESPSVHRVCRDYVTSEGGEAFFSRNDWYKRLRSVHDRVFARAGDARWVAETELRDLASSEFRLSAALFEQELGVRPRFLAYPWMLGTERSILDAGAHGIRAVFGVALDHGRSRRASGAVRVYTRIRGDWLRFLPGEGRLSLTKVIPDKVRRFWNEQHFAQ